MTDIYADEMFEELGRIAPHSPEVETALLGSIIVDNTVINAISQRVKPDDLYIKRNQVIYQAMLDVADSGAGVDYISIADDLEKKGVKPNEYGGLDYLIELPTRISLAPSMANYISIIRKLSIKRKLIRLSRQIIEQSYDNTLDSQETVEFAQKEIYALSSDTMRHDPQSTLDLMKEIVKEMKEGENRTWIKTGIKGLDDKILGLSAGKLCVIGGRASMGKTSLALSIIRYIGTTENKRVLFFSAEMEAFEIAQNMLSEVSKVSLKSLQLNNLEQRDMDNISGNISQLGNAPIWVDDTPSITLEQVKTVTRHMAQIHGVDAIFIDYLQLMTHKPTSRQSSTAENISETMKGLKQFAREMNIPVTVLAQINREVEKRQAVTVVHDPKLSDLKGSGGIEENADIVILVHRPYYYSKDEEDIGKDKLIVAKNRRGEVGDVPAKFIPHCVRWEHRVESIYTEYGG